jgi:hypothetical protein
MNEILINAGCSTSWQSKHRPEQKLDYARIHLSELEAYQNAGSNDKWENAHQESVFYHLAGAVEAMLQEINELNNLSISIDKVTWRSVEAQLNKSKQISEAFNHLKCLRRDPTTWLALLFEWRNHGTHRDRVGKNVHLSNSSKVDSQFKDPRNNSIPACYEGKGCLGVLKDLSQKVEKLINDTRKQYPQ